MPELHAEIFDSPVRRAKVPGISVLTPAKGGKGATSLKGFGEDKRGGGKGNRGAGAEIWDSDSDEDGLEGGMSPPKTMQFHVPQGRLLRTPGELLIFLSGIRVTVG